MQAADDAQPGSHRLPKQTARARDEWLLLDGNPDIRWIAAQSLAEEARRRNADHRERMPFNNEGGAHDEGIGPVVRLPGVVAHHGDWWRTGLVIVRREQTAAKCLHAQRGEEIPSDVLGAQRTCWLPRPLAAHAQPASARLERGDLVKLRGLGLEPLVQRVGVHPPAFLRPAFDAAV